MPGMALPRLFLKMRRRTDFLLWATAMDLKNKLCFGKWPGDAPDFVEVGEAGIAVDDAMRHQRRVQLVG
jgi:hypothetical protein